MKFIEMRYLEQYERGIVEFNEGRFFECHDTLEELWMDERGERRRFLQGLIQGAVGLFHATGGNFTGANSQLTKALAKLDEYPPHFLGVDVASLRGGLRGALSEIRRRIALGEATALTELDPALIPAIDYTFDPASMSDLLEQEDSA